MTIHYDNFAADISDAESSEFSSVEENEETLGSYGVDQEMKQLGKGPYRATLAMRRCGEVELFSDRFNVALSMHLEPPEQMVGFLFPRTVSGRFLAEGADLGNERLLVLPPGSGADIVVPALVGSDSILIPTQRFHELVARLCPALEPIESLAVVGGDHVRHRQLRAAITTLIRQPGSPIDSEEVSNVLAVLMASLEASRGGEASDQLLTTGARTRVARRAQEFIDQNFRRTVRIDEVCRETGVGVRTLQRSFREYFQVSFTEYLKLARLDAHHRALRAADPSRATVAELGLENGLTHLGRLSVDFRGQFGKSPSEVLRERTRSPVEGGLYR